MSRGEAFVKRLVAEVPQLGPLLDEHMTYYDELLTHVFMADVSRFAIEEHKRTKGHDGHTEPLDVLFSTLEAGARDSSEDVQELISVSFLENLFDEFLDKPDLRSRLGPALNRELDRILKAFGYTTDDDTAAS